MLWVCMGCTCRYSVGAPRCPQCGSTEHQDEHEYEENKAMAKISRHGGATNADTGQGFESADDTPDQDTAELLEHDGSDTALPPAEDQDGEELDATPESIYAGWTKADLQDEASRRTLSGAGTKAELIDRLEVDDLAASETPSGE